MFKKFLVALAALIAATAFAAVDANKASQAELESVKGIGPSISAKIIDERKKGDFKDWNDLVVRVKGIGEKNAATMSAGGLTVNGAAYAGAPAKTEASTTSKPAPAASASTSVFKEQKDAVKENYKEAQDKKAAEKAKKAETAAPAASSSTSVFKEQKNAVKENYKEAQDKKAAEKAKKAAASASAASAAKK